MKAWIEIQERRDLHKGYKEHADFRLSLSRYCIFFSEDLQADLEGFADMIWNALIEFEIYKLEDLDGEKPVRKAREELRTKGPERLKALERKLRDRLWNAESPAL